MSAKPWHKRYHGDALTGYMGLTLEERGAYTTLLDLMYDRQGPIHDNIRLVAGYLNVSLRKADSVLESLFRKGKIYRREDGGISNRRFEKELENALEMARKLSESGSRGGRTRVENQKNTNKNNDAVLTPDNPGPKLSRDQKPETRKKEESPSLPIGREDAQPGQAVAIVQTSELTLAVQAFNQAAESCPGSPFAAGWSKCLSVNGTREKQIRARLKEIGLDGWRAAMVRAARSDFLAGRARRKPGHERWGVDLTWLSKAENFTKLIEGKYDNDRARTQMVGRESGRAGLVDFLLDDGGEK